MIIHGFQQTVTLADKTILNGSASLNENSGDLWVWLDDGTDMVTAFGLFSDPAKTAKILTNLTKEKSLEFEGYTQLMMIRQDARKITVRMREGITNGSN